MTPSCLSRLFCPCAALHSDQVGGGLDFPGSPGTDDGSGQLEYGLRQRQESARYCRPRSQSLLMSNSQFNNTHFWFLHVCNHAVSSLCPLSIWYLSLSCPAYLWMHGELKGNVPLQYLAWITYPMILVMFASLFCHLVSPQAIGKLSITCLTHHLLLPPSVLPWCINPVLLLFLHTHHTVAVMFTISLLSLFLQALVFLS